MKRFYIHDEDGQEYSVEEVTTEAPIETETTNDEVAGLSEDEIAALKSLAAVADKLVALVADETPTTDEEEPIVEEKEEEETVIDTDEEMTADKCHDSKRSFGAIEKETSFNDSIDVQDSIAEAWAKRYSKGGNK